MTAENTALTTWDPNSGDQLPAYLTDAMGELGSNIPDRQMVPSLSYEGKVWAIHKDGNKTKLQVTNGDGDTVPVPIMRVVILNFNADRGRALYEGNYNPAAAAAPICWSADGKAPDDSVTTKQSPACQGCPQSVKGSKVADGREMVACSQHRMLAVAPPDFDEATGPLRLKIAVTSDWDKEVVEHGWYALRQYVDFLKSRGVTHTSLVVTKIKFDAQAQYPKLLFALDRVLTPEEVAKMKVWLFDPKVAQLLAEKWTPAGSSGTPIDNSDIAPQPDLQTTDADWGLAAALAAGWAVHPTHPGYHFKGQDVVADAELAVRYPKPAAPPAPPAPPPAPEPEPAAAAPPAPPKVPKPTDAAHIANAGTDNELWWNGAEWVKPWVAEADPAPAAPPPPPAPEPEPAAPPHDPMAAALADGWAVHPTHPGYHFKGQEVVADGDLAAKYPSGGGGAPSPAASPAAADAGSQAGGATTASPSEGEMPADVQALLSKWAG